MNETGISAVIPAHNAAKTFEATLASVAEQTIPVAELIIIDDGSTDGTAELASRLAPNARVVTQRQSGASAARNAGARLARGEWLAFVDADDIWPPNRNAALLEGARKMPAAGLICGRTEIVPAHPGVEIDERMRRSNLIHIPYLCGSTLIRTALWRDLGGMNEDLKLAEDADLFLRLSERNTPIAYVDEVTLKYIQHASNRSRDVNLATMTMLAAMRASVVRRRSA